MSTTGAHLCTCEHIRGLHMNDGQCARCACPRFVRKPLAQTVTPASSLSRNPAQRRNRQGGGA